MSYAFILLLVSACSFSWKNKQEVPKETIQRLARLYPGQSEDFLRERIKNAPSAFSKWRSFTPYYFEMINRGAGISLLKERRGECAGDAHLENFGFVADSKTSPQFTLNDLDDATECSLNADLMRLFIGHKLFSPSIKSEDFLREYDAGFKHAICMAPDYVTRLREKSQSRFRDLSKKMQVILDEKSCKADMSYPSADELKQLRSYFKTKILHACTRTKDSGGSAGGKRYLVFHKNTAGKTELIELKPLLNPAPDYDKKFNDRERAELFKRAVKVYLAADMSEHYFPITFNGKLYQRRPFWAGFEEVKESDLQKAAPEQKQAVLLYEACRLGALHRKTSTTPLSVSPGDWDKLAHRLESQFRSEFADPSQSLYK